VSKKCIFTLNCKCIFTFGEFLYEIYKISTMCERFVTQIIKTFENELWVF